MVFEPKAAYKNAGKRLYYNNGRQKTSTNHGILCEYGQIFVDDSEDRRRDAGSKNILYGWILSGCACAEDNACIRGSTVTGNARVSGSGSVLDLPETGKAPMLTGSSAVYGTVLGDVHMDGAALVFAGETIRNDTRDKLVINGSSRAVIHAARGIFSP